MWEGHPRTGKIQEKLADEIIGWVEAIVYQSNAISQENRVRRVSGDKGVVRGRVGNTSGSKWWDENAWVCYIRTAKGSARELDHKLERGIHFKYLLHYKPYLMDPLEAQSLIINIHLIQYHSWLKSNTYDSNLVWVGRVNPKYKPTLNTSKAYALNCDHCQAL